MIDNHWFTTFVLANTIQFMFGLIITGLSFSAYRSSGKASFRLSTLGFLCITIGGVLAPVYELGITRDYNISGMELLQLQIMEGMVIAVGLALLLLSVLKFNGRTTHQPHSDIDVHRRSERKEL